MDARSTHRGRTRVAFLHIRKMYNKKAPAAATNLSDGDSQLLGHEAEHAEHCQSGVEARAAVHSRDEDTVSDEVVVEVVVRAQRSHATERDRVREENLSPRVNPHLEPTGREG